MDGLAGLVKVQGWILKNHVAQIKREPILKTVFLMGFAFIFWFGALGMSYKGFRFINRFPLVGSILVDETIYLFFAALFYFLTFSVTTLFFLQINWFMAKRSFYSGWISCKGGRKEGLYPAKKSIINLVAHFLFFLPRSTVTRLLTHN